MGMLVLKGIAFSPSGVSFIQSIFCSSATWDSHAQTTARCFLASTDDQIVTVVDTGCRGFSPSILNEP